MIFAGWKATRQKSKVEDSGLGSQVDDLGGAAQIHVGVK
jgi:hypothetical protein